MTMNQTILSTVRCEDLGEGTYTVNKLMHTQQDLISMQGWQWQTYINQ